MLAENDTTDNNQGGGRGGGKGGGAPFVLLIDGPSGAGKSTLARKLFDEYCRRQAGAATLIRMDDMYPGWDGLRAASTSLVADILVAVRQGHEGTWTRWDWATARPAEKHTVPPHGFLIIEGCGAVTRESAPLADCQICLRAADDLRKRRALNRGGEDFAAHWDQWQHQFEAHLADNQPERLAHLCLDSGRTLPVQTVQTVQTHLAHCHGVPN